MTLIYFAPNHSLTCQWHVLPSQKLFSVVSGILTPAYPPTFLQAYINFKWGQNFSIDTLLNSPVEAGPGFSDSGAALARVIYIHYVSKVSDGVYMRKETFFPLFGNLDQGARFYSYE